MNTKISNETRAINSIEEETSSLEKFIINSDSNNNLNNIENSIRAFCEHVSKFPVIINIEENNFTDTVTLQNNENDMIVTQDNMIIEPINVICNE